VKSLALLSLAVIPLLVRPPGETPHIDHIYSMSGQVILSAPVVSRGTSYVWTATPSISSPAVSATLDQPPDGSVISNTVTLSATPSSTAAPIVRVEYYLDGILIATVTNPISPPATLTLKVSSP
jgi:hypothetical protein